MKYYILLDEKLPVEGIDSTNILGEVSFNKFYMELGWLALKNIIESNDEDLLNKVTIKNEQNKSFTIEQFLTEIKDLIILEN